jgi:FKBP-type peptidyl-prolyl cis-trans isomerase
MVTKKSALARKREAQEAKRRREFRLKAIAIGATVVVVIAAIAAIAYFSFHKDTFPEVTELVIKDLKVGKGAEAQTGNLITVDYTGWLRDGTKFDSSVGSEPLQFTLGQGEVIEGWDQGVAGMKVGGTRILYIPPDLAYGEEGSPPKIPPNATLKFKVKLLAVE